ncbi:MAG: glycosyltransferase family 4 protein [Desulfobacteraceae bacterium]|nr:glycosyltransferase family 4 protein [Desulfobacteraceae bacterium]
MKIAINTLVTPSKKIGVGIYIDNLLKYFHKIGNQSTYQVLVAKKSADLFDINASHLKKLILPLKAHPSWLQIFWQPFIMLKLLQDKPDVLHIPNTAPLFFKICPTVISILDLQEFYTNKYGRVRGFYRKVINYIAARIADRIITISEHSKQDIIKLLKIPEEKISVTYLSTDSSFRLMDRETCYGFVDERYNLSNHPYIISVGELHPGKNFIRLIQAFAKLKKIQPSYKLIIVGKKGWDYEGIFTAVSQLELDNDVIFTGYVSASELPKLYNGSSLTVFPTLYEGFGLPALEAMACGSPLIAANTSSIPEVVGEAGILVDPYDVDMMAEKMNLVLSDSKLGMGLITKGHEQVAKFSWDKTARDTFSVYEDLLVYRKK